MSQTKNVSPTGRPAGDQRSEQKVMVLRKTKNIKQPGIEEIVGDFVEDALKVMSPQMTEQLKNVLVEDYGFSKPEVSSFLEYQRDRRRKNICIKKPTNNIKLGIKNQWVKEISKDVADKLANILVDILLANRNARSRRITEKILEHLCETTGEDTTVETAQTRVEKSLVVVADRLAIWIDENISELEKKMKFGYLGADSLEALSLEPISSFQSLVTTTASEISETGLSVTTLSSSDEHLTKKREGKRKELEKEEELDKKPKDKREKKKQKVEKRGKKGKGRDTESQEESVSEDTATDESEKQKKKKKGKKGPKVKEETSEEETTTDESEKQKKKRKGKKGPKVKEETSEEETTTDESAKQKKKKKGKKAPKVTEETSEEESATEESEIEEEEGEEEEDEEEEDDGVTDEEVVEDSSEDENNVEEQEEEEVIEEEEVEEEEIVEEEDNEEEEKIEPVSEEKDKYIDSEEAKEPVEKTSQIEPSDMSEPESEPETKPKLGDILDLLKEDIKRLSKDDQKSDRQQAMKDIIDRRLEKLAKGKLEQSLDSLMKYDIDETASVIALWVEKVLEAADTAQKVPSEYVKRGSAFEIRGDGSKYEVNKLSSTTVAQKVAEIRGVSPPPRRRQVPKTTSPINLTTGKDWADWVLNSASLGEQWGNWLDGTLNDIEHLFTNRERKSSRENYDEWKDWRDKRTTEAQKWRVEKDKIKNEGKLWDKKLQNPQRPELEKKVHTY